ncbi:MAG: MFS transporter [Anaerolineae bacterium]|nr:MFS transporter [Anaerolineae bacterium]
MLATVSPKRNLWSIRAYYFVSIGAGGFIIPFVALFYRQQGLSGAEIGWLGTIQAAIGLVAAPIWGRWSDRLNRPRQLLQVALVGTAVFHLMLGQQDQFGTIALIVAAAALVMAGWMPLSDNLAVDIAESIPGTGFGSIRLWGSLGWTIVTAVAGRLIELFSLGVIFIGYAVGMIGGVITLFFIPNPSVTEPDPTVPPEPATNLRQAWHIIRQSKRLMGLAGGLGITWLLSGSLFSFEPIYMTELGASTSIIGMANALNAAIELPAMLWADKLVKRYTPGRLLRWALLLQMIRMTAVLIYPSVATIVVTRMILGIQYSFFAIGLIAYINAFSPKTYRATMMALYGMTLRNLTTIVGSPLTGIFFDTVGAYWLYAIGLAGTFLGWLVLYLARD